MRGRPLLSSVAVLFVSLFLAACVGGSSTTPDADAITIADLGGKALDIALTETADPVLRQVDATLDGGYKFQFVDRGARVVVVVVAVPQKETRAVDWEVLRTVSPLVGQLVEALDLAALRVGPDRLASAITSRWPGCRVRGVTLTGERDDLRWTAFCTLPDGSVVTGTMDNDDGTFRPSDAPPTLPPPDATPASLEERALRSQGSL